MWRSFYSRQHLMNVKQQTFITTFDVSIVYFLHRFKCHEQSRCRNVASRVIYDNCCQSASESWSLKLNYNHLLSYVYNKVFFKCHHLLLHFIIHDRDIVILKCGCTLLSLDLMKCWQGGAIGNLKCGSHSFLFFYNYID